MYKEGKPMKPVDVDDPDIQAVKIQNTPTVKIQGIQEVHVSDIDMAFGSMVVFMIKWAIASIPAFLILAILLSIFGGLFVGIIETLQAIF